MTLTSTYDHRVIQGAAVGRVPARASTSCCSARTASTTRSSASLRIPYEPIRWAKDIVASHDDDISKQARILELIHAYRVRGHMMADTDPLEYRQRSHPDLEIESHGLTLWDLDREFADRLVRRRGPPLHEAARHPRHPARLLLPHHRHRVHAHHGSRAAPLDPGARRAAAHQAARARSSCGSCSSSTRPRPSRPSCRPSSSARSASRLEGGETTIPLIDEICEAAAEAGLDEVAIGMAHRGRLNVLANIVGKKYSQIFREFEGNIDPRTVQGSGDVKYHLGAEGEFVAGSGDQIKVSVAANPSHLEAVDPVLEGIARAKQDVLNQGADVPRPAAARPRRRGVRRPGRGRRDAQPVAAARLPHRRHDPRGRQQPGRLHHLPRRRRAPRSTAPTWPGWSRRRSSTSTATTPRPCIRVARLAFEYRQAFNKDVVIDLVCYRRRGHNEGDDPSYTQPLMYDLIEQKRSVRKLYTESLIGRGDITDRGGRAGPPGLPAAAGAGLHRGARGRAASRRSGPPSRTTRTSPPASPAPRSRPEVLKRIADAYVTPPEGFTVHPKVMPQLQRRAAAITDGPIDWGTGEILAFGSLLMDGRPVRLAGQDSRRGTFVPAVRDDHRPRSTPTSGPR